MVWYLEIFIKPKDKYNILSRWRLCTKKMPDNRGIWTYSKWTLDQ